MGYINLDHCTLDRVITNSDILKVQEGIAIIPELIDIKMAQEAEKEAQQEEKQKLISLYRTILYERPEMLEQPFVPYSEQPVLIESPAYSTYAIDFFRNSTSAGNLYVESRLESSRTFKYAAGRGSESPSNSLPEASFERSLIIQFITEVIKTFDHIRWLNCLTASYDYSSDWIEEWNVLIADFLLRDQLNSE